MLPIFFASFSSVDYVVYLSSLQLEHGNINCDIVTQVNSFMSALDVLLLQPFKGTTNYIYVMNLL